MSSASDILLALNEGIRLIKQWIANVPRGESHVLSDTVIRSVENMSHACSGDVPASLRDVCTVAVPRLSEELRQYVQQYDGKINVDGSPVGSFWAALANVYSEMLKAAKVDQIPQFESVATLRAQKVNDHQIAFGIYGFRNEGPFIVAGAPSTALIDKEAAEPGSVLKDWPNWIPPWRMAAVQAQKDKELHELAVINKLSDGPRKYQDPDTIDQMLLDKAFVQQIEKAKGVTRNEVLQVAAKLGIVAVDQPGWTPRLEPLRTPTASEQSALQQIHQQNEDAGDDSEGLRMAIVAVHLANPGYGSAEIVADLSADGLNVSTHKVAAVLRSHRNAMSKEAATA